MPYDIFHLGGVTQAALNYLQTPGMRNGYTAQSVVGLNVSSDLGSAYGWTLPWAKDGIGFAAGIERRVEKLSNSVDAEFATGDLAGQGGATLSVNGEFTVVEPYFEFRVPIIQRQEWFYDLTFTGAYRYSSYSTDKTTNSYGLGADWSPIREAKLRGSYQQAVRAANVVELFLGQGFDLFGGSDPCSGATPTATLEQCARSGVTAAQYGSIPGSPAGQYNFLQGGNPNLEPETAKTYTLGGVLQFPNFSATLDYWHYKIENVISIVPPQQAINNCINTGVNCDLIFRGRRTAISGCRTRATFPRNQPEPGQLPDRRHRRHAQLQLSDRPVGRPQFHLPRDVGQPVRRRADPGFGHLRLRRPVRS